MRKLSFVWCAGLLVAAVGGLGASSAKAAAQEASRLSEQVVNTGTLGRLHVTRSGRVVANIPPAPATPTPQTEPLESLQGGNCGVLASHTGASFTGGTYTLQGGFAEQEIAAVQYAVPAAAFPIKLDLFEAIFGTQAATVTTTTQYTILVWSGPPTGAPIFEVSSDNVILPHIQIPPGTNGVNLQFSVDPGDPDQIIINNDGSNTFSIGVRIDVHNEQTANPCFTAPPASRNAFPATDNTVSPAPCALYPELQQPLRNWLFGVNCGPNGCPANGGWSSFAGLAADTNVLGFCIPGCRPHGDWVMRATWSSLACTPGVGACCFGDGSCQTLAVADCQAQGGTYQGDGVDCASANCPQPTGGCCFSNGSCIVLSAANCQTAGGSYVGDNTTCAANNTCPLGACCLPDGTCTTTVAAACSSAGGTFRGAGTNCANANCPPPTGACCLGNGGCIRVTASDCALISGTYLGNGSACTPQNTCPTGACCFADGTCAVRTSVACANEGGSFAGVGVSCANANCPQPTGACCLSNGACLVLGRTDCLVIPGASFAGANTTCEACNPACAADFNGDGDLNPDDLGDYINCYFAVPPCAEADFNGDGDTNPDDLGDYINAYFLGC